MDFLQRLAAEHGGADPSSTPSPSSPRSWRGLKGAGEQGSSTADITSCCERGGRACAACMSACLPASRL
eukprot:CAMPEP_0175393726 /NCGR_PEP_ID=MMETSP0095-20121207/33078_1 /TAXON_ID=311494 /ORGANISM="Alexandrium monilatum, Strain CCMP3105" /LENGTH=68 /DNA_ID=CAMNT_0016692327 /DNA_START=6 /DNA_END=209 /DNA_ORIENTATION=+